MTTSFNGNVFFFFHNNNTKKTKMAFSLANLIAHFTVKTKTHVPQREPIFYEFFTKVYAKTVLIKAPMSQLVNMERSF